MAKAIGDNYYEYDGFVILHGTDTMAYTASALSFMLENLSKPVIVTGSQLPLFHAVSDARANFLGAVTFAGLEQVHEVCVYFNTKLMRGNRVSKADTSAMDAFSSLTYPILGQLGSDIKLFHQRILKPPRNPFKMQTITDTDVVVLWVIHGFSDKFLEPIVREPNIQGLVLMLYGCGSVPGKKAEFLGHLKELVDKGIVVVACSQCRSANTVLELHPVGKAYKDIGVVAAGDMTVEAAVSKISYLFSKNLPSDDVRKLMSVPIRGEMSAPGVKHLSIDTDEASLGMTNYAY